MAGLSQAILNYRKWHSLKLRLAPVSSGLLGVTQDPRIRKFWESKPMRTLARFVNDFRLCMGHDIIHIFHCV